MSVKVVSICLDCQAQIDDKELATQHVEELDHKITHAIVKVTE